MALTLASNAITFTDSTSLSSGVIGTAQLSAGAVTTQTIANSAVDQQKIAANVAVTGPAFRVYSTTATSVPNTTVTKINLQTKSFDTHNYFNTTTSRFTPLIPGYYWISMGIRCESLTNGHGGLLKNGEVCAVGSAVGNAVTQYNSGVSDLIYLNGVSDYVEVYGYQATGTTQNMGSTAALPVSAHTFMSGFLARSA